MKINDVQFYKTEIDAINLELDKLPQGYLAKKGSFYYETHGTVQKGITKDQQKIRQLTRKAYLLRRLKHIEWNFSLINKQFQHFKTEDPTEIIQGLPSFFQTLPISYFFRPSVNDRLENTATLKMPHKDGLIYMTNSGIYVRSKSERTIADALDHNKILYRYEAAISIGNVIRYPDFTIYRLSDEKMILWEHFGLMDNDEYRQMAIEKIYHYARYGFFPFDNLICSYEYDLRNPAHIQTIIETFLLR